MGPGFQKPPAGKTNPPRGRVCRPALRANYPATVRVVQIIRAACRLAFMRANVPSEEPVGQADLDAAWLARNVNAA